jgi:hypothetical protein
VRRGGFGGRALIFRSVRDSAADKSAIGIRQRRAPALGSTLIATHAWPGARTVAADPADAEAARALGVHGTGA